MKGFRQSRLLKAVAVVLLFFSIIAMPLSAFWETYLIREIFNGNPEEMLGGNFKDSERFSSLFSRRIGQLAEYVELKNILETAGTLDYSKSAISPTVEIPDSADEKGFSIGELIKSSGIFVENIDTPNAVLLEELFTQYPMEVHYICTDDDGEPFLGTMYADKFIKDFYSDEDWLLVEDYEDALLMWSEDAETAEKENLTGTYLVESAYGVLSVEPEQLPRGLEGLPKGAYWVYTPEDIAYYYTYYVAYYQHYQTLFGEPGGHRMLYRLRTEDGAYTNAEGIEQFENGTLPTDGELYYGSEAYTVDTDVADVNRAYVDDLEKAVLRRHDSFDLYVAVAQLGDVPDTQEDAFTIRENRYNKAQDLCRLLLIAGIAGVFGTIIAGFYLAASAGHEKGVEGVRLTWFDKWYTEAAALAGASVIGCGALTETEVIQRLMRDSTDIFLCTGAFAGAIVCYLAALFSLASLVRRIKARTLWSNSLLRSGGRALIKKGKRFSHVCRVIYAERDITTRVIVAYIMVLAATTITGAMIMVLLFAGNKLVLFFLLLFAAIHGGTLYMLLRERIEYKRIMEGVERISGGELNYKIDEKGMQSDNKRLAVAVNRVGEGLAEAVEKSIKDERMKTDLITNVSHDIKTPLTSIINYVDLLKRERIENEKVQSYIEVLDNKSQRLKNLTDDLVEASKLSSGTVILTMQEIDLVELVNQADGEFSEKFGQKQLQIVPALPEEPVIIEADGRRLWRVLENLYNNVAKYAMEGTRVYVAVVPEKDAVAFVMKNISASPLNINADELTERFIRGDVSRSTEGSGLGLSIARSLTELMKGSFDIYLDGDLFRVTVAFPMK